MPDDAQLRGVSPPGQKSQLFLMLKGSLVGASVRNSVASGMVRGWQAHPGKADQHCLRHPTIPLSFKHLQACGRALKRGSLLTAFGGILFLSRISPPGHTSLPAGKPFASAEAHPTRESTVPKKRGKEYDLDETTHYDHYLRRR